MPGVLVFSKTYCSFCAKLKALLRELRIPFRTEVRGGGGGTGDWNIYDRHVLGAVATPLSRLALMYVWLEDHF